MSVAAAPESRSAAAGAGSGHARAGDGRPDDLLHALAQLPESVTLEIGCTKPHEARLRLLARAYGIDHRVRFRPAADAAATWRGDAGTDPVHRRSAPEPTMAELVESLWPGEECAGTRRGDDGMLAGHRVALVTNLPAHYRVPLLSGLADRLGRADAALRVFFLGANAVGRSWLRSTEPLDFEHEFLRGMQLPVRRRRPPFAALDLLRRLREYGPTVLLAPGFSPPTSIPLARYAGRHGVPLGLWSGEIAATAALRSRSSRLLRTPIAARADFGISYGSLAERYLLGLAPDLPVVHGRNTSVISTSEGAVQPSSGRVELLAVADLGLPGKGLEVVLDALGLEPDLPCRLTIVGGEGEGSPVAEKAARDSRIRLAGALPPGEVQRAYETSHGFVFPSRVDVFGLALVEAMAAGLPAAVSDLPGATADLGRSAHNCLVVPAHEPRAWARALRILVEDRALRVRLGEAARLTIRRRWTMEHAVDAMIAGLRLGVLQAMDAERQA